MADGHLVIPLTRRWARQYDVGADDLAALGGLPWTHRHFGKDDYLVREGQAASECAVLLRGFAFRQKLIGNGGRQIISFHIPGEFVDLQNALIGIADHNVQSLSRTEVAAVPRIALWELAEQRPALRRAMWIDTLIDSAVFREWVVNVGRRNSRARIAHLLCELALRLRTSGAGDDSFAFPVTQEQLADATGLTAVHTNRTLQGLRRDGLIQLNGGSLTIMDWDRLRQVGDFDELYLHQQVIEWGSPGKSIRAA